MEAPPTASACGRSSSTRRARRALARLDARTKEAAATAKRLERELKQLKRGHTAGSADRPMQERAEAAPRRPAGGCGDGLDVNTVTSCPFARNVRTMYYAEGEPDTLDVYSPVTGRTYTMDCTASSPHVCTGGNNARVTFP